MLFHLKDNQQVSFRKSSVELHLIQFASWLWAQTGSGQLATKKVPSAVANGTFEVSNGQKSPDYFGLIPGTFRFPFL